MEPTQTSTFYFDSLPSAAKALYTLLLHARLTEKTYRFSGLTAKQVLVSGLTLTGEIAEIADILEKIPGALRYND